MNDAPKSAPDTPQGALNPFSNDEDKKPKDDLSGGPSEDNRQGSPVSEGSDQSGDEDLKTVVAPANTGFVQEVFDAQVEAAEADAAFKDPKKGPETVEKDFTIVQHLDPARQADPNGVYLDDIQRQQAEVIRARVEGREPDFKNPGTTAGDVVVPTATARSYGDGNAVTPVAFKQEVLVGSPQTQDTDEDDQE